MTNYQVNEAKRIGLQRTIDAHQTGIFSSALKNSAARALRRENARRTLAAS